MSMVGRKAVVLLSGGVGFSHCVGDGKSRWFLVICHVFFIRTASRSELDCARTLAAQSSVIEHREVEIDLSSLGGSALTTDTAVPKHDSVDELPNEIPSTYVPARNTIFSPMP